MNPQELNIIVPHQENAVRLDIFLSSLPEIQTRSRAAKLIQAGSVNLKPRPNKMKASLLLYGGEEIFISLKIEMSSEDGKVEGTDIPLNILYEDEDVLVINKPAGLVVHPSAGHQNDTLVNALLHYTKDLSMGFGEERPGIVHRLDKDTSGSIVVAKNNFAHEELRRQFDERSMERYYWAICFGVPKPLKGKIESMIARHPIDRKIMASSTSDKSAKRAITNYETLASYKTELSLVKYKLETGRTHQIRVHSKESLFPILGDWAYCKKDRLNGIKSVRIRKEVLAMNRFCLHAAILGFQHPRTKEQLRFLAPIPEELAALCKDLGFDEAIRNEFHL